MHHQGRRIEKKAVFFQIALLLCMYSHVCPLGELVYRGWYFLRGVKKYIASFYGWIRNPPPLIRLHITSQGKQTQQFSNIYHQSVYLRIYVCTVHGKFSHLLRIQGELCMYNCTPHLSTLAFLMSENRIRPWGLCLEYQTLNQGG